MTLIEVLVAVTIIAIVVVGAVAFVVNSRIAVELAGKRRTATQVAAERLERARGSGYAAVANAAGTLYLDGTTYTWTLTVFTVLADPADAGSAYKLVEVSVNWPTSDGSPVVLRTAISP